MKQSAASPLAAIGLGAWLALAACGSVTAKHTDGGGTGGTHLDSSTKTDLAADHRAEDAHQDALEKHDSSSPKDMLMKDMSVADARATDASSRGGSGGGGGTGGGGTGGSGTGGGGGVGECQSNGDCMLYTGAGKNCCGVCQPKSDPAPPPMECLVACLTPLVTCGCSNQQCVGSAKGL